MSDLMQWVASREALERDIKDLRARFADIEALLGQAPIDQERVAHWQKAAAGHLRVAREISLRRPSAALIRQIDEFEAAIASIAIRPAASGAPAKAKPKKRANPTKSSPKKRSAASRVQKEKPKPSGDRYVPVFTDEPQTCKVCGQTVRPFKRRADILDSHRDEKQRWCQGGVLPAEVTNAMSRIASLKRGDSPKKKREDTRPVKVVSGGLPTLGRRR